MSRRVDRVKLFFKVSGFRGLFIHFVNKYIPSNRFDRGATLLDFKICGLQFADDVWQMLSSIKIEYSPEQIEQINSEFEIFTNNQRLEKPDEEFPRNWNSGESLRLLLFAFTRLVRPDFVVEVGTANGYSTSAIAYAFELNRSGKVHSFDIRSSSAPYVLSTSRSHLELHVIEEDPKVLLTTLQTLKLNTSRGFYFHDADHSYFGQYYDFEIAKRLGFKYYVSDDVEASMVFCERAEKNGSSVLFDGRKFIGVSVISAP
jgi:predicted O-methyltransferase YrrM